MARSRNIKPGFFSNDTLAELPALTRLLFIGLWTLCDRAGRVEDRHKKIKAEALPYDDCDVDGMLQALHDSGFIRRYTAAGVKCIQVVTWDKHQNPHMKEAESTIPAPDSPDACTTPAPNKHDAIPEPEQNEQSPLPERAGLIPDSLNPITTLSGKPDPSPPNARHKATAIEVLAYLNEKSGRSYHPVEANIDIITARLKDGATVDELRGVIERKCEQWLGDEKMAEYLRPATLFNRTKFAQYQGETGTNKPQRRAVV